MDLDEPLKCRSWTGSVDGAQRIDVCRHRRVENPNTMNKESCSQTIGKVRDRFHRHLRHRPLMPGESAQQSVFSRFSTTELAARRLNHARVNGTCHAYTPASYSIALRCGELDGSKNEQRCHHSAEKIDLAWRPGFARSSGLEETFRTADGWPLFESIWRRDPKRGRRRPSLRGAFTDDQSLRTAGAGAGGDAAVAAAVGDLADPAGRGRDRRLARLGHLVEGGADDHGHLQHRRGAAARPVAAQVQGHRLRHGQEPQALPPTTPTSS